MDTKKQTTSGYLLLIEDDVAVQENNKTILERRGYEVRLAYDLAQARAQIKNEAPRAIILDIQLPDGSGLDYIKELRESSNVPALLLTSLSTPDDIIRGLDAGGDDYLTKPYDLPVFLGRINALLRRASFVPDMISYDNIKLDIASAKAIASNVDLNLSQKEFMLLKQFIQFPEQILSADYLYEKVWGQKKFEHDNALKVAISKLRTKLDGTGFTIYASRGEGYSFEKE